ncbi:MAG: hypothetical protein J5666_00835 [Bacilli bacterium]|nr:hypothetical protein [Bacilli bacterium]
MKKIFIYFSLTGNGDLVSDKLPSDIDKRKVIMKKNLPKKFFFMVMTGGFLAGMKVKSKLVDFDNDVKEYDEVIIGSPIWNGRFSSPINTVLSKIDLKDKKVSFILYSGSGEAKKATKLINKKYPNASITILKEPKKYNEELDKLLNI